MTAHGWRRRSPRGRAGSCRRRSAAGSRRATRRAGRPARRASPAGPCPGLRSSSATLRMSLRRRADLLAGLRRALVDLVADAALAPAAPWPPGLSLSLARWWSSARWPWWFPQGAHGAGLPSAARSSRRGARCDRYEESDSENVTRVNPVTGTDGASVRHLQPWVATARMILRIDRLQTELPPPSTPDPAGAAAVQELMGGKFGEMSTLMNYTFQSFNYPLPPGHPAVL